MEVIKWDECDFKNSILDRDTVFEKKVIQVGNKKVATLLDENISDYLLERYGTRFEIYKISEKNWYRAAAKLYSYIDIIKNKIENTSTYPDEIFNLILKEAILQRSSDIHISIRPKYIKIGFRIDGIIYSNQFKSHSEQLLIYIKAIFKVDIISSNINLDGKNIQVTIDDRKYTLRLSMMGIFNGVSIVIRIFQDIQSIDIKSIMRTEYFNFLSGLLKKKQGMGVISGGTGSGKSTTLYGTTLYVEEDRKIISIENPVEFINPKIIQVEGGDSSVMRLLLRQDPDIIMLSEVRDLESANFACSMSLSGHLLITTIHAQSAKFIPVRFINLGITNPIMLGEITWIACQHLALLLCNVCKKMINNNEYIKQGCDYCRYTGYDGRILIEEFFTLDEKCKNLVREMKILEYLEEVSQGMRGRTIKDIAMKLFSEGKIDHVELDKVL